MNYKIVTIVLIITFTIFTISSYLNGDAAKRPEPLYYAVAPHEKANLISLPNLELIDWPEYDYPNISVPTNRTIPRGFDLKIGSGHRRSMDILLQQFEQVMISMNMQDQWFLGSGSLLGSLQHHDMIPWDDDLDVGTHIRHRHSILAALKKLEPTFETFSQGTRDKFYFRPFRPGTTVNSDSVGSYKFPNYSYGWPFMDIFYITKTELNLCREVGQSFHKFDERDIYPVTYRPFGKRWFPAPKYPVRFLRAYYGGKEKHVCSSHFWLHSLEIEVKMKTQSCRKLMNKYPFVHRCPIPDRERSKHSDSMCDEYLLDGNANVIHKIRTTMMLEEIDLPFFMVKHESFECPR